MSRVALKRQAEEALSRGLQPGERIAAGSRVTCGLSRRGPAALLAAWLVPTAAVLESLWGPLPAGPVIAVAVPVLGLGIWFLPRPMYVAVTDRRLICWRLSRSTLRRLAFTVPLADLRIVNYRSGKYGTSVWCECPGRRPMLLHAGREEFAGVDRALARAGAYAKLDPPYPPARNLPKAARRH
jgi:hypothetical protein